VGRAVRFDVRAHGDEQRTADAANVVVSESTPAGTIFVSATPSQARAPRKPSPGGTGAISCNVGSLNVARRRPSRSPLHSTDAAIRPERREWSRALRPTRRRTTTRQIRESLTSAAPSRSRRTDWHRTIHGTQTGRLARSGAPSVCAFPKPSPGVFAADGERKFDAYQLANQGTSHGLCAGRSHGCHDLHVKHEPALRRGVSGGLDPTQLEKNYLATWARVLRPPPHPSPSHVV